MIRAYWRIRETFWRLRETSWSFDETLYRLSRACFALWLCSIAIFAVTAYGLPHFQRGTKPTGCYLRDALLIYVECAPQVWAGGVIEAISNFAWWLVIYSWILAAPTLFAAATGMAGISVGLLTAGVVVFASLTLFGALGFVVAAFFRRL